MNNQYSQQNQQFLNDERFTFQPPEDQKQRNSVMNNNNNMQYRDTFQPDQYQCKLYDAGIEFTQANSIPQNNSNVVQQGKNGSNQQLDGIRPVQQEQVSMFLNDTNLTDSNINDSQYTIQDQSQIGQTFKNPLPIQKDPPTYVEQYYQRQQEFQNQQDNPSNNMNQNQITQQEKQVLDKYSNNQAPQYQQQQQYQQQFLQQLENVPVESDTLQQNDVNELHKDVSIIKYDVMKTLEDYKSKKTNNQETDKKLLQNNISIASNKIQNQYQNLLQKWSPKLAPGLNITDNSIMSKTDISMVSNISALHCSILKPNTKKEKDINMMMNMIEEFIGKFDTQPQNSPILPQNQANNQGSSSITQGNLYTIQETPQNYNNREINQEKTYESPVMDQISQPNKNYSQNNSNQNSYNNIQSNSGSKQVLSKQNSLKDSQNSQNDFNNNNNINNVNLLPQQQKFTKQYSSEFNSNNQQNLNLSKQSSKNSDYNNQHENDYSHHLIQDPYKGNIDYSKNVQFQQQQQNHPGTYSSQQQQQQQELIQQANNLKISDHGNNYPLQETNTQYSKQQEFTKSFKTHQQPAYQNNEPSSKQYTSPQKNVTSQYLNQVQQDQKQSQTFQQSFNPPPPLPPPLSNMDHQQNQRRFSDKEHIGFLQNQQEHQERSISPIARQSKPIEFKDQPKQQTQNLQNQPFPQQDFNQSQPEFQYSNLKTISAIKPPSSSYNNQPQQVQQKQFQDNYQQQQQNQQMQMNNQYQATQQQQQQKQQSNNNNNYKFENGKYYCPRCDNYFSRSAQFLDHIPACDKKHDLLLQNDDSIFLYEDFDSLQKKIDKKLLKIQNNIESNLNTKTHSMTQQILNNTLGDLKNLLRDKNNPEIINKIVKKLEKQTAQMDQSKYLQLHRYLTRIVNLLQEKQNAIHQNSMMLEISKLNKTNITINNNNYNNGQNPYKQQQEFKPDQQKIIPDNIFTSNRTTYQQEENNIGQQFYQKQQQDQQYDQVNNVLKFDNPLKKQHSRELQQQPQDNNNVIKSRKTTDPRYLYEQYKKDQNSQDAQQQNPALLKQFDQVNDVINRYTSQENPLNYNNNNDNINNNKAYMQRNTQQVNPMQNNQNQYQNQNQQFQHPQQNKQQLLKQYGITIDNSPIQSNVTVEKQIFYKLASESKKKLPRHHSANIYLISELYEEAQSRKLPIQEFQNFINYKFSSQQY